MREFVCRNRLIATNTFLKRRACHITLFEQEKENFTCFNQTDYFLATQCKEDSLRNSQSYINQPVDTDHRLVTAHSRKKETLLKQVRSLQKQLRVEI